MSSTIFWALVGIVCLSPLPLASNRPLPWSLLSIAVGVLLLLWGASRFHAAMAPVREAATPAANRGASSVASARAIDWHTAVLATGFVLLMAWYAVQGSSDLSGGWGHAAWSEASTALGERLPAAISLDPAAGETLMMKIIAYGGIFLLALQLGRDRGRARMAFWLVSLAGLAYALYGLFVQFTGARAILWFVKDAYPESVTATFINRNAYATYAGITILAGLGVLVADVRRLRSDRMTLRRFIAVLSERGSLALYVVVAATLTGLVAVALTGSRAGTACLVLGLFVFGVGMLIAREIRPRTFLVGAALGAGTVAAVLSVSGGFLAQRLSGESGPEARAAIFDVARAAAAAEPWVGHGLGGFAPAFNRANDGRAVFDTYVDLAHNAYLELAVEGGVPALLFSLALIGSGIGVCFAGLLARGRNAGISIAAVAIAALVGAHALVDFGIQIPAVAATFMLLIGVSAAQALSTEQIERAFARGDVSADTGSRWRSPRRQRGGLDRPLDAEEPVTPPPTLDVPWPVRSQPPDLSRTRLAVMETEPPEPSRPAAPVEVIPPETPIKVSTTPDEDYQTALARWRALRPADDGAAATPGRDPRPARTAGTHAAAPPPGGAAAPDDPARAVPSTPGGDPRSTRTANAPPSTPRSGNAPTPGDPARGVAADPRHAATARPAAATTRPTVVRFEPPGTASQPPMPDSFPASRDMPDTYAPPPGSPVPAAEGDDDKGRPTNIVELPRPPRP